MVRVVSLALITLVPALAPPTDLDWDGLSYHLAAPKRYLRHHRIGFIAYDYAALGDKDQTFAWLEKAYSEKAGSLGYIKVMKAMDSLRSDPRYIDLLKRMGLAQ